LVVILPKSITTMFSAVAQPCQKIPDHLVIVYGPLVYNGRMVYQ
jgi:hypothetical protein